LILQLDSWHTHSTVSTMLSLIPHKPHKTAFSSRTALPGCD